MPLPAYVAPNELIESAWGNLVVDALTDHETRLDEQGPFDFDLSPVSNTDATTSGTTTTWLSSSAFTVPAWVTSAIIQVNVTNVTAITNTSVYTLDVTMTGGSYTSEKAAITFDSVGQERSASLAKTIATTPGSRAVLLGAARATGSGQMRAQTSTKITGWVMFR